MKTHNSQSDLEYGQNPWDDLDDEKRRNKLRGIYAYGLPGIAHISNEQFGDQAKNDDEGGDVKAEPGTDAAGVDAGATSGADVGGQ